MAKLPLDKAPTRLLPISGIRKSPFHWDRELTNEDIDDLADSFNSVGQINPLIVRKNGTMYEYLAGERRYKAAGRAGWKSIKCTIVHCSDEKAQEISLVENLKVKKPNSKEWKIGVAALIALKKVRIEEEDENKQRLERNRRVDKPEATKDTKTKAPGRPKTVHTRAIKEVAKELGVSEKTVTRAESRDSKLVITARIALKEGRITGEQADELTTMSEDDQYLGLPKMIRETRRRAQQGSESTESDSSDTLRVVSRSFEILQRHMEKWKDEVVDFRGSLTCDALVSLVTIRRDRLILVHREIGKLIEDIETTEIN